MMKKCTKCSKEKLIEMFHNSSVSKDGKKSACKECRSIESKIYREKPENKKKIRNRLDKYRKENIEKIREKSREYAKKNKQKRSEYSKKYQEKNKEKLLEKSRKHHHANKSKINKQKREKYKKNPDRKREKNRQWYKNNKKEINKKRQKIRIERSKKDISYKLNLLTSNNIRSSLKNGKNGNHWETVVGYTLKDLMDHLESLFEPWMNWENHGVYRTNGPRTWQIDHIIPKSMFKFKSYEDEEFKLCWSLNNLKPMCSYENNCKQDRFIG